MYTIAMCDDDAPFLAYASELLCACFERHGCTVRVKAYASPHALLQAMGDDAVNAIFLDLMMPELDGLSLARSIQELTKDRMIPIVFLSNHDALVFQSLQLQPLRFIRKRRIEQELDEAVAALLKLFMDSDMQTIVIEQGGQSALLRIAQIQYVESFVKEQHIHMLDKRIYMARKTLTEIERQLEGRSFVRTHKSYLVNCRYIHLVNKTELVMQDGTCIPLSRYRVEDVKRAFIRNHIRESFGARDGADAAHAASRG